MAPGHVEATLGSAFFHHAVHAQGRLDPLQTGAAEVVAAKIPLHQPVRCLTDRHRIGRGEALQPSREVGRLAQGQLLMAAPTPHGAYHYRPRMDADPHGEPEAFALLQAGVQRPHGVKDAQTGTDSPLGVIFMGLRIAKVH